MRLRIGLYIGAAILLGAHFLRGGDLAGLALCLAAPFLFFWRSRWSLYALQLLAYVACAVWIGVAIEIVQMRMQLDQRWTAAALILGAVTLYTLIAGLLLNSHALRARYAGAPGRESGADALED